MTKSKSKAPVPGPSSAPDPAQNAAQGLEGLNTDLLVPSAGMRKKIVPEAPPWAPTALVDDLIAYRMTRVSLFEYPDDEQAMLERILTRPGMNIVWQSIETACSKKKIDFDGFVRQVWHQLAEANAVINRTTKTPAQTREELGEIAESLGVAVRKIERNRTARILSKIAVLELIGKNLTQCLPSTDNPIIDQLRQAGQVAQIRHELFDPPVAQRPREAMLANALEEACNLSLVDVAKYLIQEIEDCAEGYKGEVKDLGNPAPVFVRRVRGLFKDYFNQPMSSTVAALLNVALDRHLGDITEELVRKTR